MTDVPPQSSAMQACSVCGSQFPGADAGTCDSCAERATPTPTVGWKDILRRLGPAGVLGVAWAVVPGLCGFILLYNIKPVAEWLGINPTFGLVGYICVFAISAGLGVLPTYAQAVLGGWVFGLWQGTGAALAGFVGGSTVGYVVSRFASRDRVEQIIEEHPKWRAVRDALIGGGYFKTLALVALVRLPPNSPFALTNLVMASAGVRPGPYLLGTAIGMLPRTALLVFLASRGASSGAADIQGFIEQSRGNLWMLLAAVALWLFVVFVLAQIGERAIARVTAGQRNKSAAR